MKANFCTELFILQRTFDFFQTAPYPGHLSCVSLLRWECDQDLINDARKKVANIDKMVVLDRI